ncbi:alpha/beta fold hydrolase [Nonomuraea sp. NPDC050536]|uniref:alpha/beta fold hydrolase n=1 Tax=Nonomuraea sp. NPDC050536 TaxID=3364366 RepID=UPI0037CC6339
MVRVNGVWLAYDEAGSGPAVVLVHAGIADRRMWDAQVEALSESHRVIRYDWRGYGESEAAEGEFAHHEDLLGLLGALEVERAALVGCSMGGSWAVEAALTDPARVSGLVLICSGLSGHTWPEAMLAQARERVHASIPADRLRAYRAGVTTVDPADLEAFATAHTLWQVAGPDRVRDDLDPAVWERAMAMMRQVFLRSWTGPRATERPLDAKSRLGEIQAPTLVINGLSDVPWIQEVSNILTQGIQNASRIDLPDTGHLPPLEHPEEVTKALQTFLQPLST